MDTGSSRQRGRTRGPRALDPRAQWKSVATEQGLRAWRPVLKLLRSGSHWQEPFQDSWTLSLVFRNTQADIGRCEEASEPVQVPLMLATIITYWCLVTLTIESSLWLIQASLFQPLQV